MTITGKPRLLDLFCGAGGAAKGYQRAGFYVVGVDIDPQLDYCGDEFHQADAMTYPLDGFDAIHASPPCHDHSSVSGAEDGSGWMLEATITRLTAHGAPWVCENVVGPDVRMAGWWFVLCGSMFNMKVRRHRRFGSSHLMLPPPCQHAAQPDFFTITGNGGGVAMRPRPGVGGVHRNAPSKDFWRHLDMPWMEGRPPYGVAQAIPPAYTEWIGEHLMAVIEPAG